MSTAILISGQLRTLAKCWPTQRWQVLRHFADPHFFICVQAQPDWHEILAPLMAEFPDRVHIDLKGDPDLSALLTPSLAAAYHEAPYANAAPAHQLLLQHWYQNECWKYFQRTKANLTDQSDPSDPSDRFATVIRMRADLWFHSFEYPYATEHPPARDECRTPAWAEFGGINDRFAIMDPEAAKYYFTVWDHIPELLAAGCPFHPESLVAAALERGNVDLHRTLKTYFSTERLDGTRRWPEIHPMDMLSASLRAA